MGHETITRYLFFLFSFFFFLKEFLEVLLLTDDPRRFLGDLRRVLDLNTYISLFFQCLLDIL